MNLNAFFNLNEMHPKNKISARIYLKILTLRIIAYAILDTFLILIVLDFLSVGELSIILSIRFVIIACVDFPTGVLSDILGYRNVLIIALIGHIISLSIYFLANTYREFLIAYTISAIASSQESGALRSWFDNHYQTNQSGSDPNKKIYGAFTGRILTLNNFLRAFSYLISGIIAVYLSRRWIIGIDIVIVLITLILIIRNIDNKQEKSKITIRSYFTQMYSGLTFLITEKGKFFFFIGSAFISGVTSGIWAGLLLFPLYESYSSNDFSIGVLRSFILIFGIITALIASKYAKHLKSIYKGLFISQLILGPVFYFILSVYYYITDPVNSYSIFSYFGLILIFQILGISEDFAVIINSRIIIDIVPNKQRNTIYSLLPTLMAIFGGCTILFGGYLVQTYGVAVSILACSVLTGLGTIILGFGLMFIARNESNLGSSIIKLNNF